MAQPGGEFDLTEYILSHVQNGDQWKLPFLPPIELPQFLSLHALMLVIGSGGLLILFCKAYNHKQKIPTGITNALEAIVLFIRDEISITHLGEQDGRRMTPLFCTFFFFILFLNLLGIIPAFAAATSNINVTAALALVTFGFMTIGAMVKNGVGGFFHAFIYSELPLVMRIILFPIEFLGVFIKTFALTIRLFANMLAGHMIILALVGLVGVFGLVALPSVLLAVFIYMLEVFVSLLQAYIFTLLSAVFIGQVHRPAH